MSVSEERDAKKMKPSNQLVTTPNLLSFTRGILGPVAMSFIVTGTPGALAVALVLMITAEFTDFLDGIVARRFGLETEYGKVIDPVCDSIYHLSVFVGFVYQGWMPAWMLFVIYSRDLVIPYIRTFARQSGVDLGIRDSGKIKTAVHAFVQIGVVGLALNLFGPAQIMEFSTSTLLLMLAAAVSIYSLVDYGLAANQVDPR